MEDNPNHKACPLFLNRGTLSFINRAYTISKPVNHALHQELEIYAHMAIKRLVFLLNDWLFMDYDIRTSIKSLGVSVVKS